MSVLLAEHLNIMVVGYVRQDSMNVYTHPWRLTGTTERADEPAAAARRPRSAPEPTAARSAVDDAPPAAV
jgi:hypothetical protein